MTPEETFNQQVWQILQRLKEEILATASGKPIRYRLPNIVGAGIIPKERREQIIYKLQEWGALRVRENPFELPASTQDTLYLDIEQSGFDSIYTKFQKTCDPNAYLNEYQQHLYREQENPPEFSKLATPISETSLLIERLESVYQRTKQTVEPRVFFSNLFEYVDSYFRVDLLKGVVGAFRELEDAETSTMKKLETDAYSEIDKAFQELFDYCSKANIENAMIAEAIKDYRSYEKGTIESSEGPLSGRMGEVEDILRGLAATKNASHLQFVRRYAELTDDGLVRKYTFSPSFIEHKKESGKQERLRETRPWFSWNKLFTFHNLYSDHDSVYQHYMKAGRPMTALSAGMLADELNIILTKPHDPNRYVREFHPATYLGYLERVHLFSKELLVKFEEYEKQQRTVPESSKKEPKQAVIEKTWYFDSKNNSLHINNTEIKFKNDSLRSELLRFFSKNKANQTSEHHFTELFSEINGSEPTDIKKAKRKMYDAVQGLVAQIATKTGQQNFLIYNATTVRVSPQFSYKKP